MTDTFISDSIKYIGADDTTLDLLKVSTRFQMVWLTIHI